MKAPSLQRRIRNGTLLMLALVVLLGLYTLPRVYALGGAIRATLYRNYVSIEAAQNMHTALNTLQVAEHDGKAKDVLPSERHSFLQWSDVENHDFTEIGEPELAADIVRRGNKLFDDIAAAAPGVYHDREFAELNGRLDDLIAMNKAAMFRADSRSVRLGKHLAYEFAGGLALVLLVGAAVSWGLGWRLSKPLTELAERLRGISQRKSQVRLGPQPLAELEAVAREFNQMAERLEQYDKLNVERLVYEKSKTEAIIESLEDGVVLIDSEGIVAHINEIASLILGVDPKDALGSPFDDLSSNHPHYLRVRDALRTLQRAGLAVDGHRTEIDLHVRGRDHSYVLKPVPLHHTVGKSLGTLLILQDVTYIRDQDRARTNLVATLSHELRTPLTSLALSAELLNREEAPNVKASELLQVILEECSRMRQLTDNLLNLARGEIPAIAVQQKRLDLARLAADVARRFAIQAREKHVSIEEHIGSVPEIIGDPVKLSWVVSNLLGNALRYTPAGGTIKVSAVGTEGATRLEVTDSGPGIPADMKDYIFERFVQYGSDGAEKGSAGLGLSIVKEIVEAHGGRIFVESDNSHGARFIVEIPAAMAL
ncbi:MAG TPA: ATP-binding protein [Candidatus Acidoferrum sp.]|nr:ATP-binding protein [Candidatus Acidoferrum sp.]